MNHIKGKALKPKEWNLVWNQDLDFDSIKEMYEDRYKDLLIKFDDGKWMFSEYDYDSDTYFDTREEAEEFIDTYYEELGK